MIDDNKTSQELNPDQLRQGLKTKVLGQDILFYSSVNSTNEEARVLAEYGSQDGTVVIAETQTGGRGRRGRTWVSPMGGLWFTIILKPKIAPVYTPIITLLTGVACANAIEKVTGLKTKLKWPNDVHIAGKKVCGILTEISSEPELVKFILVGLGINVNIKLSDFPNELQEKITTLSYELNKSINRDKLFQELLKQFENLYIPFAREPIKTIPKIISSWRKISDTLGRDVKIQTVSGSISGLAAEISEDGALLVKTKTGKEERIIAGDCIYLNQN